jgi:hypothetical protein
MPQTFLWFRAPEWVGLSRAGGQGIPLPGNCGKCSQIFDGRERFRVQRDALSLDFPDRPGSMNRAG